MFINYTTCTFQLNISFTRCLILCYHLILLKCAHRVIWKWSVLLVDTVFYILVVFGIKISSQRLEYKYRLLMIEKQAISWRKKILSLTMWLMCIKLKQFRMLYDIKLKLAAITKLNSIRVKLLEFISTYKQYRFS